MDYKRKRITSDLSFYTIAKRLGISEEDYRKVEKGEKELDGERLEKFLHITDIDNAKMIKFNRMATMNEIKEWCKTDLNNQIKKYGYTKPELAKKIGISVSSVFYATQGVGSDDMLEKIYDFLHDTMNKKERTVKEEKRGRKKKGSFSIKSEEPKVDLEGTITTTISDLKPENIVVDMSKDENVKVVGEEDIKINAPVYEIEDTEKQKLIEENERLKRQIMLYEKLIEKL